jgi:hypothetical protein
MKTKEIYMYALAALYIGGFFVMAWLLRNTPENSFLIGVIETLKMGVVLILGYFFGSSKSSADKNEMFKNQNNNDANNQ